MTDHDTLAGLRVALNDAVGVSVWHPDDRTMRVSGETWNTLVGGVVMATNGDLDARLSRLEAIEAAARDYVALHDTMSYPETAAMYPAALRAALEREP